MKYQAVTALLLTLATCGGSISCRLALRSQPAMKTESKLAYYCHQVGENAVCIDGVQSEEAWEMAEILTDFKTAGADPNPASYQTTCRLLWSRTRLFATFFCQSKDLVPAGEKRDDPVWEGEAVEIFLCPEGEEKPYYEIDVNPNNVIYDARILNWRYEYLSKHWEQWATSFNPDIRSAVSICTNRQGEVRTWSVEIAVPFEALVESDSDFPQPGREWLFNTFRAAKPADGEVEFSAWEPTRADFHRPYKFPRLLFVR